MAGALAAIAAMRCVHPRTTNFTWLRAHCVNTPFPWPAWSVGIVRAGQESLQSVAPPCLGICPVTWAETGVWGRENRGTLTGKFKEGMMEDVSEVEEVHGAGVMPGDTRQQGVVPSSA